MADGTQQAKVARIGVRISVPSSEDPFAVLDGYRAAVYDMDTGALLPAESVNLHIPADGIVTATVKLVVSLVAVDGAL
jgi:hypothetical protein